MPLNQEEILAPFIADLQRMEEELVKKIEIALKGGLTDISIAQLEAEINIFEELNALGYGNRIGEHLKNYDNIVLQIHQKAVDKGLTGLVGTSAVDLEVLIRNEEIFMLDKGRLYTSQFRGALFNSMINGQTIGETLTTLRGIPLTDAQLTVGLSTGMSRFYRTTTAEVYKDTPEQRFLLTPQPLDVKTRASCSAVIKHQPKGGWTKKEIDSGAATKTALEFLSEVEYSPSEREFVLTHGYNWLEAGGFNCRHEWEPI